MSHRGYTRVSKTEYDRILNSASVRYLIANDALSSDSLIENDSLIVTTENDHPHFAYGELFTIIENGRFYVHQNAGGFLSRHVPESILYPSA